MKIIQIILSFFSKSLGEYKLASFQHKTEKSSTKVYIHYWIVCLFSKNICYNIFISHDFFNFCWNMFNSKAIKIGYTTTYITDIKAIYWVLIDSCSAIFIRYVPSLILDKLFLEWKPLNLGSFLQHFCISKLVKGWGGIKNLYFLYLFFLCPTSTLTC